VSWAVGVDRRFRGAYCMHHQNDDSAARKDCWLYRNRSVQVKLGQTSGEREDDQARKLAAVGERDL
jgi:hypothetical protein